MALDAAALKLFEIEKIRRKTIRSNVTKLYNKTKNYLAQDEEIDVVEIQTAIDKLTVFQEKLAEINPKIFIYLSDARDVEEEVQSCENYDDEFLDRLFSVKNGLKAYQKNKNSKSEAEHQGFYDTTSNPDETIGRKVNLPKLEIAKFDGDAVKWQEFWDSFQSTIHNNDELSQIDKFKYLKAFLEKDALRIVEGYKLTSANYDEVVECLQERFGNPETAIFSHFETMLALPVASNELKGLQTVFDECEKHVRSIVALGVAEETFSIVFCPIILSKLPKFVRIELHRQNGLNPWKLSNLRKLLKTEIQVREMSQHSFGSNIASGSSNVHGPASQGFKGDRSRWQPSVGRGRGYGHPGTAASLLNAGSKPKCIFCDSSHDSESCRTYPDATSRRAQVRGRCFVCLRDNHFAAACRAPRGCRHCKRYHHSWLCPSKFGQGDAHAQAHNKSSNGSGSRMNSHVKEFIPRTSLVNNSHRQETHMQTALADICSQARKNPVQARLIFDTASSRTYITRQRCREVGATTIGEDTISIAKFGTRNLSTEKCSIVKLDIICLDGSTQQVEALVTDYICCPAMVYPIDFACHPSLRGLRFAEPVVQNSSLRDIDVLIGGDFYYKFVTSVQTFNDDFVLLGSKLGYILAGKAHAGSSSSLQNSYVCTMLRLDSPILSNDNYNLERFWKMEDCGITDKTELPDDELVMKNFNETVQFENGRYSVRWPWKTEVPDLPSNFPIAMKRLKGLIKRLQSDAKIMSLYSETIQRQEQAGIIERVGIDASDGIIHYIPHHCVVKPDKATTKLRIVYDASAKASVSSLSLNECIHRGPVILGDICGLLLRFRRNKVGLVSDIEKAFLQVSLQMDQRDVTRFLWIKHLSKPLTWDNLIVFRFCRIPFGVIASPFLLTAVIQHHLTQTGSPVCSEICDNNYVDNVISGSGTSGEARSFYTEAKAVFNDASMNLREWYSNDSGFMGYLDPSDRGADKRPKVLGMVWDLHADTLGCPHPKISAELIKTKRQMLQSLARMYDPCGFFAPITVVGKSLLQELWRQKFDWDDVLPDPLITEWTIFSDSFLAISSFPIPRYIGPALSSGSICELHCFCDASAKAYAAVVYLKVQHDGKIESNVVFSKSRVSPIKTPKINPTIPRLELLAVVVGSKIIQFVEKELKIPIAGKFIWTDSQCVLHWIAGQGIATKFVTARVEAIKMCKKTEFLYVPSAQNPADLPSRGCSAQILSNSDLWWKGPPWLQTNDNSNWPVQDFWSLKQPTVSITPGKPNITMPSLDAYPKQTCFMDISRFSTFSRLIRTTGWIFRFLNRVRKNAIPGTYLQVPEINAAKTFWLKQTQGRYFSSAFGGTCVDPKLALLRRQLKLFIDPDGLIRCKGRLGNSDIPPDANCPILLPKNSHFTDLMIADFHMQNCHVGVNQTLAEIRYVYWVPQGRVQVKRVLNNCRTCRKVTGGPFQIPVEPPLPSCRVTRNDPFAVTGLDYLGPLYVKCPGSTAKVWICLFTCAVVRAVHLEVVPDLSSEQFLMCLRRFVSFHGKPDLIISDNASQLHASHRALVQLLKENQEVADFSTSKGIQWKFIPEFSPWMGGFYERLVGVVKSSLKKTLGRSCLRLIELQTVIAEITSVVNSRPLTQFEADDVRQPLTPAHFLSGKGREGFPKFEFPDTFKLNETTSDILIAKWKLSQNLVNSFWDKWTNEYLLSLREHSNFKLKRGQSSLDVTQGSIVLIKDSLPRGHWKTGKIVTLRHSADGSVRAVDVLLPSGKQITRPVKLLYPVEVPDTPFETPYSLPQTDESENVMVSRPKRRAAITAAYRIHDIAENDAQNTD